MNIVDTLLDSGMSKSLTAYTDMLMPDDANIKFVYTVSYDSKDYEEVIVGYTLPHDFQQVVYILRTSIGTDGSHRAFVFG